MDTPEQFSQKYLDADFDYQLLASNNPLINSSEFYLTYKQNYLEMTRNNLVKYTDSYQRYNELVTLQHQQRTPKKVIFTIIDTETVEQLKQELKNILILQRHLYDQFYHYVGHLNTNISKYTGTIDKSDTKSETNSIRSLRRSRNLLSRLKFK
jgi:anti-sigma28 factor (negative regulator of flagellin synthesis)